jgi:hypothetical protein
MNATDWAQLVFTGVAGVFGLFCLFDGARRIAAHGPNPSGRQMIGVGVAIVLLLAGYAYWKHRTLADVARAYQPIEPSKELPDDWGRKSAPAKREAQSLALARGTYLQSGALREYFDASGKRLRFVPAQADVKQREIAIGKAAQIAHDSEDNFLQFLMWLVWGAAALVFGPLFAREPVQAAEAAAETETVDALPAAARPPNPAAPAKSRVGEDTVPLPHPAVPAKPAVGDDTIPLPKPAGGGATPPRKA